MEEDGLPPYAWSNPTLRSREGSSDLHSQHRSARYMQTASGMKKLIGIKEGEWFRNWEGPITRAVIGKYQSSEPLRGAVPLIPAQGLDGYNDGTGTLVLV